MQTRRRGLTPGRMLAVYVTAALLVLVHEADRLASWLEDLGRRGESWPFARILDLGADLKELSVSSGLAGLKARESRALEAVTPRSTLGTREAPPRSPAPAGTGPRPGPVGGARSPSASPPSGTPPGGAPAGAPVQSGNLPPPAGPHGGVVSGTGQPGGDRLGGDNVPSAPGAAPSAQAVPPQAPGREGTPPAPSAAGEAVYSPPAPGSPAERTAIYPPGAPVRTVAAAARRPDYKNILIVGDSFMVEGFGPVLERELKKIPELVVKRYFKSATGLCRPDFFDWNSYMEGLLEENAPELVVLSLGANDTQDIVTDDRKRHMVASEGWNEVYGERVRKILDMAGDAGATVFWVGLPIMGKKLYNQRVSNLNSVVSATCAEALNCRFFDTWEILTDEPGVFTAYRTMPSGKHERIRAKDSIHLTELGGEILVTAFLGAAGAWGIYGIPDPGAGTTPEGGGSAGPGVPEGSAAPAASGTVPGPSASALPGGTGSGDRTDVTGHAPDGAGPPGPGRDAAGGVPGAEGAPETEAVGTGSSGAAGRAQVPDGPLAALRPPPPRPAGSYPAEAVNPAALIEVNLPSRARMRETSYLLCLPGPEDVSRPTVILLHGPDENYLVWRERFGRDLVDLARSLNVNLIMPDGDPYGWYLDSPVKRDSRVETYIMRELLPDASERFLMDPGRVGLLGVSMGGHGALTLALKHPGRFRSVSSISGITVLESHIGDPAGAPPLKVESVLGPYRTQGALWRQNSAYHMVRRDPGAAAGTYIDLTVGVADQVALGENRQFHRLLNDLSVPHGYREGQRGGHDWSLWAEEVPGRIAEVAGRL